MEKRQRIIESALRLFLRNGIRATTMEAIAREAGIAKQTLYSQFPSKEAVAEAVLGDIVEQVCYRVDLDLGGPDPIEERIGRALGNKLVLLHDVLGGSPHAHELFSEHSNLADKFEAADRHVENQITGELRKAGIASPEMLARQLLAAAYGFGQKLRTEDELRAASMLLVKGMVATAR